MSAAVLAIYALVYGVMALGRLPGLALERSGAALLGAIAVVVVGAVPAERAWSLVDMSTLYLLFALMVLSAQLRLSGFYTGLAHRLAARRQTPPAFLALVVTLAGGLSALLTNDVVCLALAPVVIESCGRRGLDPVPHLLGLACASNVGSAATLIGNPQNILIGQRLGLSFAAYAAQAALPTALGLLLVWFVVARLYRDRWEGARSAVDIPTPPFSSWQTGKGLVGLGALVVVFLAAPEVPRELAALVVAGALLLSRRLATREFLGLVDWPLLVLFAGLFVVNGALQEQGLVAAALGRLEASGLDAAHPAGLFGASVALSNLVSNVPATMLLLPGATHPLAGPVLALSSTLAGNLLVVGSIANMIVVTTAAGFGVRVDLRTHARVGVPVTLATLTVAALWLWGLATLG